MLGYPNTGRTVLQSYCFSQTARPGADARDTTVLTMADTLEKKPVEPAADPRGLTSTDMSADDADMALAAMGYKPVCHSMLSSPPPLHRIKTQRD